MPKILKSASVPKSWREQTFGTLFSKLLLEDNEKKPNRATYFYKATIKKKKLLESIQLSNKYRALPTIATQLSTSSLHFIMNKEAKYEILNQFYKMSNTFWFPIKYNYNKLMFSRCPGHLKSKLLSNEPPS